MSEAGLFVVNQREPKEIDTELLSAVIQQFGDGVLQYTSRQEGKKFSINIEFTPNEDSGEYVSITRK